MYDLKSFWKDFISTFKRINIYARWGIVVMQIVVGFHILMVCIFSFTLPLAECITYSFVIPGLLIWIPVLWRKWERTT